MNVTIYREGQQYGPYSLEEIRTHLASGALQRETDLAWHEGLTEWLPLDQLLAQLDANQPPAVAVEAAPAIESTRPPETQPTAEASPSANLSSQTPALAGYQWTGDKITPNRTSFGYQIGLLFVALVMIVLPMLYLALCAAVGYGVFWYATACYPLLGYRVAGIVLYLGGIVAGCVALIFLVKPLFHSREFREASIELNRKDQPRLFEFIDEVCARLKSPKPVKVRLDARANASAGFEHGWLGMMRNRLVLTIGSPLLETLTVAQFGGVLAHEFGHFSQAAATRLSYVTRSINMWFARVVFERDRWDATLAALARRRGTYSIIIFGTTQGLVWVARQFLRMLMLLGHMVSSNLMRQMEYDADYYEQQIVGRANFRQTFLALRVANLGWNNACQQLERLRIEKRLVDDIPKLVGHMIARLPKASLRSLEESLDADRSIAKWNSTHPSDYQRLGRAEKRNEEGVLQGAEPAMSLLQNFEPVAKALTKLEYKMRVHAVSQQNLIPTAAFIAEMAAHARRNEETRAFFGGLLMERRLFFPQDETGIGALPAEEVRARYDACSAGLSEAADETADKCAAIEALRVKRANAIAVKTQKENGVTPEIDLGLPDKKIATIDKAIEDYSAQIRQLDAELKPLVQLAAEKLVCFCRLAELAGAAGHPAAARVAYLKNFLNSVQPIHQAMNAERKSLFVATVLASSYKVSRAKKRTLARLRDLTGDFSETMNDVAHLATKLAYPLQDKRRFADLNAYFVAKSNAPGPIGQLNFMRTALDRFDWIYMAVMTELLATGAGFVLSHETSP